MNCLAFASCSAVESAANSFSVKASGEVDENNGRLVQSASTNCLIALA